VTRPEAHAAPSDLAIVLPAKNDATNLRRLLPALADLARELGVQTDVIVVDGGSADDTVAAAEAAGARVVRQTRPGYGAALVEGIAAVEGSPFVVTMDADLSHHPWVLRDLWATRETADLVVASRYVAGGGSQTSGVRRLLSRLLNAVYSRVLAVPVRDLSSGYRLYRTSPLRSLPITSTEFDVLPEILVRLYAEGYRIREVPFQFASHIGGRSRTELATLGWYYLKTLWRMWNLRNSVLSADYDHRAFDSRIALQRYWQRERHRIILRFIGDGGKILDVGCGSSRILQDLPGSVGVDVLLRKLRFVRPVHPEVAQASVFALPFPDASFDTVICSEVIEHVPDEPAVLGELTRVLRPNGVLVLGTPDYGRIFWHIIEWVYGHVAPGGYADEHITHFDRDGLRARLVALGYEVLDCDYVGACEMIFKARRISAPLQRQPQARA
jgi:dolichol-phosphate mannosyltransferase